MVICKLRFLKEKDKQKLCHLVLLGQGLQNNDFRAEAAEEKEPPGPLCRIATWGDGLGFAFCGHHTEK